MDAFETTQDESWMSPEARTTYTQDPALLENRQLLWHGSGLANWGSILKTGLRIAPPEAPATGWLFDKGVRS